MNKLKAVWALLRSKNYILFTTPDCELTWSKNTTVGDVDYRVQYLDETLGTFEKMDTNLDLVKRNYQ